MGEAAVLQLVDAFVDQVHDKVPYAAQWIWAAFRRVQRHTFIDQYYELKDGTFCRIAVDRTNPSEQFLKLAYGDNGILICEPHPRSHSAASQPSLVAIMLHHLDVSPGLRILEIGAGSGWNAALMACGVGTDGLVATIDIQGNVVDDARRHLVSAGFPQVKLLAGDGAHGWEEHSPFDRIVATVGCPDIPPAWLAQLADGGVLLVPLKTAPVGDPLLRLVKRGNLVSGSFVAPSWFMTLQGAFCTATEDALNPPWGPQIAELLAGKPEMVRLPHALDFDALFFAWLSGMHLKTLVDWTKRLGPDFAVFDSETETITVPDRKEPIAMIYGHETHPERWTVLMERWDALGRPKFTDYSVELPQGSRKSEHSPSWRKQRSSNTYEFSLPEGGPGKHRGGHGETT